MCAAERVGVSGLFEEFRERGLKRDEGTTSWPRPARGEHGGCIFRSARVPAGFPTPFRRTVATGYFAFCYIIVGFDYAKRLSPLPPYAVCTFLPLSFLSFVLLCVTLPFSPRTRRRPVKSRSDFRPEPCLFVEPHLFAGIFVVHENWKRCGSSPCLHCLCLVSFSNSFPLSLSFSCFFFLANVRNFSLSFLARDIVSSVLSIIVDTI